MIHTYFSILVLSFLLTSKTWALPEAQVYDYDSLGKFIKKNVVLKNLLSNEKFDGEFFKIVVGKSSEPVSVDNKDYAVRAAHIYYHLTKARDYFLGIKDHNLNFLNQKIIIRIDLKNAFDNYGHFAHDDFSQEFNTAVTIPPSDDLRIPSIEPWKSEIWFRPGKEIFVPGQLATLGTLLNQREIKNNFHLMVLESSISQYVNSKIYEQIFNQLRGNFNFLTLGIGLVAIEFLPKILVKYGSGLKSRFYLDTGMVPEIIYHEYAHFALSDEVELTSTPVIEGLANYFAGKISNKAHWGNGPYIYSTDRGRNAYSQELYDFRVETKLFSTGDFVFKLLWGLQKILGPDNTDKLIYKSREGIDKSSNIKFNLINNLFKNLNIIDANDINHQLKLHIYMQDLGL